MEGQKASLFATDPPYLVDYDGTNHPGVNLKKKNKRLFQNGDSDR